MESLLKHSGIECRFSLSMALDGTVFDQFLQGVLNGCFTDRGDKFHNLALCKFTDFVAASLAHQFDSRKLFEISMQFFIACSALGIMT